MSATMETVLGIVRNPYGYTDDQVRAARLALADAYEREVAEVEKLTRAAAQPADRAEPAPLTDAQIEALWDQTFDQPLPLPDKSTIRAKHRRCLFARAILAAGKP